MRWVKVSGPQLVVVGSIPKPSLVRLVKPGNCSMTFDEQKGKAWTTEEILKPQSMVRFIYSGTPSHRPDCWIRCPSSSVTSPSVPTANQRIGSFSRIGKSASRGARASGGVMFTAA